MALGLFFTFYMLLGFRYMGQIEFRVQFRVLWYGIDFRVRGVMEGLA